MKNKFTAVYQKTGKWYSAWVEEIPGVNTQGATLSKARENLGEAVMLVVEANRILNRPKKSVGVVREELAVTL